MPTYPQSVLYIGDFSGNWTRYNQSARKVNSLLIDGFGWDVDADYWLEFHEIIAGPQPLFMSPFPCAVTMDIGDGNGPQLQFYGQIVGNQPYFGQEGRSWAYKAMGCKYLANWIPVSAIDGSGIIRFNVNPTQDIFAYTPDLAGQSIGNMIQFCLTHHEANLNAYGIYFDATTVSQLADPSSVALTLVPLDEVDVQGERLWIAIESVLSQWARNIRLVIVPTLVNGEPAGMVRVIDVTTGTPLNLELGSDPVDPPLFSSNWTHSATRMTVRGAGLIEPGYVSSSTTPQTLTPAWTAAQAAVWTYSDFLNPPGWTDNGSCTELSPLIIQCTSSISEFEIPVNGWDSVQAWIYLYYDVGSGTTFTESRPIASNTASTGGVYQVTLQYALTNAVYTSYKIIANGGALTNSSLYYVGRLYNVTDPGGLIANHLVRSFPVPVGYVFGNNQAAVLTSYPIAAVTFLENEGLGTVAETGYPPFTVDPVHGQICFVRPVMELGNSGPALNQGGSAVNYPSDITCLLAYSRGALNTTYPTSGYSGTAYTVAGLERTGYCDVLSWTYAGNAVIMQQLCQMLQTSVGNTMIEGTAHYKGLWADVLNPTLASNPTPGFTLSFSAVDYTTGWESLAVPIRACSVQYQVRGGGLLYTTDVRVSSRMDPRTGENYFSHLSQRGMRTFGTSYEGGAFSVPMGTMPSQESPFGFTDEPDFSGFEQSMGASPEENQASKERYLNRRARRRNENLGPGKLTENLPGAPQSTSPSLAGIAPSLPGAVVGDLGLTPQEDVGQAPEDVATEMPPEPDQVVSAPRQRSESSVPSIERKEIQIAPEDRPDATPPEGPSTADFGTPLPDEPT